MYKPYGSKLYEIKTRREKIANELLINAVSSETSEFDFNFIDMKREFFMTYLPFIMIKTSKNRMAAASKRASSFESFISRADYAFITAKPRVVNTKFTAPSTDNDYGDEEEESGTTDNVANATTTTAPINNKPVNDSSSTAATVGDIIKTRKGLYTYEDLSCLNIIAPNERF